MELQKMLNTKANLRVNNKARGDMLPDFTLYYKAILIKTVCCWDKNVQRSMEQPIYIPTFLWSINF